MLATVSAQVVAATVTTVGVVISGTIAALVNSSGKRRDKKADDLNLAWENRGRLVDSFKERLEIAEDEVLNTKKALEDERVQCKTALAELRRELTYERKQSKKEVARVRGELTRLTNRMRELESGAGS